MNNPETKTINIINNSGEPLKIKRATKARGGFAMIRIFKKKKAADIDQIIIDTIMQALATNQKGLRDAIKNAVEK